MSKELEEAEEKVKQTITKLMSSMSVLEQHQARTEEVIRTVTQIQQELDELRGVTAEAIENYRDLLDVVSRHIRGDQTP